MGASSGGTLNEVSDTTTMNTSQATNITSMNSLPPLVRSEADSKISWRLLGSLLLCGLLLFATVAWLWRFDGTPAAGAALAAAASPPPTLVELAQPDFGATIEALSLALTPPPSPTPSPSPIVVEVLVEVEVTRVVDRWHAAPTLPPVAVEVIREVEVQPSPTSTMIPGFLRLCLYGEGLTGLYVNDVGVAGNTCQDYWLPSPVVDFSIRATK